MRRVLLLAAVAMVFVAARPTVKISNAPALPALGTQFHSMPRGVGRVQVEAACLPCHSADMLAQQRLNEKQWTAGVDKMIRWGAVVADADKAKMILYLSKNFGPENKFTPIRIRPAH